MLKAIAIFLAIVLVLLLVFAGLVFYPIPTLAFICLALPVIIVSSVVVWLILRLAKYLDSTDRCREWDSQRELIKAETKRQEVRNRAPAHVSTT